MTQPNAATAALPPAEGSAGVPGAARKRKGSRFLWWAVPLAAKFAKVLKVFKAIKAAKLFLTLVTMALSVFVYSFRHAFAFALGFVLLLFVHEIGHVAAAARKGHPVSAPVFIPMVGALVFSPSFKDAEDEAYVGYGGPFVGTLSAAALFVVWAASPGAHELLLLLAYSGAFLNLFNLIPLSPLDGGRVTQAVGPWFKAVGLALLFVLALFMHDPGMLFILVISLDDVRMRHGTRFMITFTIWLTVVGLFAFESHGYENQPWLVAVVNVVLCGLVLLFYAARRQKVGELGARIARLEMRATPLGAAESSELVWLRGQLEELESGVSAAKAYPPLPPGAKAKWFVLYAGLVAGLFALMAAMYPHLPAAARH